MENQTRGDCDFDLSAIVQKVTSNSVDQNKLRIDNVSDKHLHTSAVLVPLVVHNGEVALLYTLRSNSLERHSGQVSFPGGVIERGDKSAMETALRETEEEIGISRVNVRIIGQLNPFNTSTGYIVFPFIGIINSLDSLARNAIEVDKIFCIPLKWLCDPSHSKIKDFVGIDGKNREVWFFDLYDGELLWGITAKITKDLLEEIKK
jgi:8-oxo-dGTP pyrophosphatase MutT (NUDIX family)